MPTIRITQALQKSMKAAEFEAYLVGSGKPTGVKATVNGEEVSWGEDVGAGAARGRPRFCLGPSGLGQR